MPVIKRAAGMKRSSKVSFTPQGWVGRYMNPRRTKAQVAGNTGPLDVGLGGVLDDDDISTAVALREAEVRGLNHRYTEQWERRKKLAKPERMGEVMLWLESRQAADEKSEGRQKVVLRGDDYVMLLSLQYSHLTAMAFTKDIGQAHKLVAQAKRHYPLEATTIDTGIEAKFWFGTEHGPNCRPRKIDVTRWQDIASNYPAANKIDQLVGTTNPDSGGKLILWHGKPGTGKTYAIRALAREWAPWCQVEYVTDPEHFFGDAAYMMQVLLGGNEPGYVSYENTKKKREWRLFVCEDVGELMATDAKQQTGQALSRLLNLTEGLIGQGLKILILFTTNEPMRELHPAVWRPGRCLAEIEFRPFGREHAQQWLAERGSEAEVERAQTTLAELYEQLAEHKGIRRELVSVGFGAGAT